MDNRRITIPLTVAIVVVLLPRAYAVYAVNEVRGTDTGENTTEDHVALQNSTERDIYRASKIELDATTSNHGLPNIQKIREEVDNININDVKENPDNLKDDLRQDEVSNMFVQTEASTYYSPEKNQNRQEMNSENDVTTVLDDLIRNSMHIGKQELKQLDFLKESKSESVSTTSGPNYINYLIEKTIESSSAEPALLSQENPAQNEYKSNQIQDNINNGTKKELNSSQTKSNQTLNAENLAKLQLLLKFLEKNLKKKTKKKAMMQRNNKEDLTGNVEQAILTKLKVKDGFPKYSLNCFDAFQTGRSNGSEMLRSMVNSFRSNFLTTSFTIFQIPIGFAMGAVAYGRCMLNHLAWNGLSAVIQNGNLASYRGESKSRGESARNWRTIIDKTKKAVEFLYNLFKR